MLLFEPDSLEAQTPGAGAKTGDVVAEQQGIARAVRAAARKASGSQRSGGAGSSHLPASQASAVGSSQKSVLSLSSQSDASPSAFRSSPTTRSMSAQSDAVAAAKEKRRLHAELVGKLLTQLDPQTVVTAVLDQRWILDQCAMAFSEEHKRMRLQFSRLAQSLLGGRRAQYDLVAEASSTMAGHGIGSGTRFMSSRKELDNNPDERRADMLKHQLKHEARLDAAAC